MTTNSENLQSNRKNIGNRYLEVKFCRKKSKIFNFKTAITPLKLIIYIRKIKKIYLKIKNKYTNIQKRTIFSTSGYCYPEVKNILVNISVKTKIFLNIFWGVDLLPR